MPSIKPLIAAGIFGVCAAAAALPAEAGSPPAAQAETAPAPRDTSIERLTSLPRKSPGPQAMDVQPAPAPAAAPMDVAPAAAANANAPVALAPGAKPVPAPKGKAAGAKTASPAAAPAPAATQTANHAPAAAEKAAPIRQVPLWSAREGQSLRSVLLQWSKEANWSVVWNTEHDYVLRATADFEGEFIDSASALIEAFAAASPPVRADLYAGNRVIVVTTPSDLDAN